MNNVLSYIIRVLLLLYNFDNIPRPRFIFAFYMITFSWRFSECFIGFITFNDKLCIPY